MKTVLIIYAISWFILLLWFGQMYVRKKMDFSVEQNVIWFWVVIFIFAPIIVLTIPFVIILNNKNRKEEDKREIERRIEEEKLEIERKLRQEKIDTALRIYDKISKLNYGVPDDYITVARNLHRIVKDNGYDVILKCLTKISLSPEFKLKIMECEQSGTGDKSKLYIKLSDDKQDFDIFKYLNVEHSCMGAWQAYLLYTLWHILPLWWHSNYDSREFVFNKDAAMIENLKSAVELAKVKNEKVDVTLLAKVIKEKYKNINDVAPKVLNGPTLFEENDKYYISCCYWTMFGGLIREFVEITIQDNKVKEFFPFKKDTISKFECGIRF